jgi:hypothetical protein
MKNYFPDGSLEDPQNAVGYAQAQTMVQVLKLQWVSDRG